MSELNDIFKETRASFIIAKSDGVLDSSEVIQIAVELAQKVSKLANLSGSEKKALLLHALKKGLEDAGGLAGITAYAGVGPDVMAAVEEQLLGAASVAVDLVLSAASGKLDLKKPANWLPSCCMVVKALIPKDQKLLQDALKFSEKIVNKDASVEDVVTIVNETVAEKPVVEAVLKQVEAVVEKKVETAVKKVETVVKKAEPVAKKAEEKKEEVAKAK